MVSLVKYFEKKFLNEEVTVSLSDLRQVSGKLTRVYADGVLVHPYRKETPVGIPTRNILTMEKKEE